MVSESDWRAGSRGLLPDGLTCAKAVDAAKQMVKLAATSVANVVRGLGVMIDNRVMLNLPGLP